jgi:site-specific recombinase XerD
LKNRLAEFAREVVPDLRVAPNHAWRHRFKTKGLEAGIGERVLDAIHGHAARTAGDAYGEVTVKAMAEAVGKLPRIDL